MMLPSGLAFKAVVILQRPTDVSSAIASGHIEKTGLSATAA